MFTGFPKILVDNVDSFVSFIAAPAQIGKVRIDFSPWQAAR